MLAIVVVFDLEGVLIDNHKRLRHALRKLSVNSINDIPMSKKTLFWKIYFDPNLAERLDSVNLDALKILLKKKAEGYKIAIISGAPKEIVNIGLRKLREIAEKENHKLGIDYVFWRPPGDKRKASAFKLDVAKRLKTLFREEIVEIHDDDYNVIESFRKIGVKTYYWRNLKLVNDESLVDRKEHEDRDLR
ncbi:MAG: hypothetical protein ACTSX9_01580 [Candidatus Njordarchaeales archaeon]